jgi:quercetin dioxygenase-like cupin family protein
MDILKFEDMVKGWFVGDFEPTAYKTKEFEVSYKIHPKGEQWEHHYHKIATEVNYLIEGHMTMCGKELNAGDIFIVKPNEIADPEFHDDCKIICVKTPSIMGDKYIVNDD